MEKKRPQVFLTFDVEGPAPYEDVLEERTIFVLMAIVEKLKRNKLKAIFFLPGSVAGTIQKNSRLMDALHSHEIGYHSSTHSIRPMIFEFTDIPDYNAAVEASIKREIQPFHSDATKNIQERGLLALQETFQNCKIISFRAPFMCWSPPHLEALQSLGVSYDFSSSVTDKPFFHSGIMFFPPPLPIDGIPNIVGFWGEYSPNAKRKSFKLNLTMPTVLRAPCTVLSMHPARLVFKMRRDYLKRSSRKDKRGSLDVAVRLCAIELLLVQLNILQRMKLIEVTPSLKIEKETVPGFDLQAVYSKSVYAARKLFHYNPRFLFSHFKTFFSRDKLEDDARVGVSRDREIRMRIMERLGVQVGEQVAMKAGVRKKLNEAYKGVVREFLHVLNSSSDRVPKYQRGSGFGCDTHGRDVESGLGEYVRLLKARDSKLHVVLVLGSRVKGKWLPTSDVDVTIISDSLPKKSSNSFSRRLYDFKVRFQYSDRPLYLGIEPSCSYSTDEFLEAIEQFDFQALDALFYGKVIYDDGFWRTAVDKYEKLEKQYGLDRTRLKDMLEPV